MTGSVLWYVHDHGSGHLARARAVIPGLAAPVVVAAGPGVAAEAARTLDVPVVPLPSDVPGVLRATPGPWHHAPPSPEVRARALAIADVVAEHDCATAVVDVSVEVTVLARLLGLRVVTLRQSGRRDDEAHRIGFESADVVWVPQHRELEPAEPGPNWVYTGSFSRYDGAAPAHGSDDGPRCCLLVVGGGGTGFRTAAWRQAAPPVGWQVVVVGADETWCGPGVRSVGHVEPVLPWLQRAHAVVTSGGWASVADAAALRIPVAVIAEERPFDEQVVRAAALAAAGLVVALDEWPSPAQLPGVLARVCELDRSAWSPYHDGHGARRAAELIDRVHAA